MLKFSRVNNAVRKFAYFERVMKPQIFEEKNYENAIATLNGLQSNANYIKNAKKNVEVNHLAEVKKFLNRSGLTLEDLDKLPVIHVAGTKGKGTTCAICESILRHHGYKTGFYSSPHLIEVRERIRINGIPIEKDLFAKYCWEVYEKLESQKEHPYDMPQYFRFLTVLAYNIFLKEEVDVAIVEVGIGGEYDCTNVIRKTQVVGITSLGFDHTNMLGDTIEEIAWNKAGIMKKGCSAFTVPQDKNALKILQNRKLEKDCTLEIVHPLRRIPKLKNLYMPSKILKLNASLAVALASAWTSLNDLQSLKPLLIKHAIENVSWPGRFQILTRGNVRFFLDGAHTQESLKICIDWYLSKVRHTTQRVLMFNVTGGRNSELFLKMLQKCHFQHVFFVPNIPFETNHLDIEYIREKEESIPRCQNHKNLWIDLEKQAGYYSTNLYTYSCVNDALQNLFQNGTEKYEVLVTGSIHLIGAAVSVIQSLQTNNERSLQKQQI